MKIEKFQLCFTICFDKTTVTFCSYSIRNYNAVTLLLSKFKDALAGTFSEI